MSVVVAVSNVVPGAATVGHDCTDRGARCHHGGTMTRPLWALFLLVSWLPFTIALLDFHLLILDFGDLLFHRSAPRFQKLANYFELSSSNFGTETMASLVGGRGGGRGVADSSWDDDTEVALWHIFIATNCKHNPKEPEVMRRRDLVILMRTCKGEATIPIHAPLGRTSSCTLLLLTPSPPNIVALFVSGIYLAQIWILSFSCI